MFADKVKISVLAGKGGDGRLSFRHEKFRARGGPDGGDGGRGGNVALIADHNMNTLADYRTQRQIKAGDGQPGGGDRKHGKNGEDITLKVPVGTVVFVGEEQIADLSQDGQFEVIAHGGRGGFGNAHFTSSTRQAPRAAELGEPGDQKELVLELKLVADVGLVGLPNAGKSTLLSVISNAKPEIGDYPFTTLTPNLGVVDFEGYTFLVADIPGLIEGANKGKGLGDEFLRHIERTSVLIHLIDANSDDVARDYDTVYSELRDYTVDLTDKPQIVVLTKTEGLDSNVLGEKIQTLSSHGLTRGSVIAISAVAHKNLDHMLRKTVEYVKKARQTQVEKEEEAIPVIDVASQPDLWEVLKTKKGYEVKGSRIEAFARRTNWDNEDSVDRFRDILRRQGIEKELSRHGAAAGDKVVVAGHEFEF
jgi:GTP-binding protein